MWTKAFVSYIISNSIDFFLDSNINIHPNPHKKKHPLRNKYDW